MFNIATNPKRVIRIALDRYFTNLKALLNLTITNNKIIDNKWFLPNK